MVFHFVVKSFSGKNFFLSFRHFSQSVTKTLHADMWCLHSLATRPPAEEPGSIAYAALCHRNVIIA